jgi:hypothetical protein
VSAPVHIAQDFLILSRKSADRRANLHIVPKFGLVIPTFSSLSLWFMKPLLDCRHPSSNGSLSHRLSYISSHIHSKYLWILISSSVMGILYTNLVIDTDILLSIVILSSLYGLSKALARPSSSFSQWPFTYGSHSSSVDPTANLPIMPSHINFVVVGYRQKVYRRYQNP